MLSNTYIINLEKDKERLQNILLECDKAGIENPTVIKAVNGKELTQKDMDGRVDPLFSKIGSRSAIGCALSHINAWGQMIKNGDEHALFLEDDAVFIDNFKAIFTSLEIPTDFGILYLGCVLGCDVDKKYDIEFPIAKLLFGKMGKHVKQVRRINKTIFTPSLPLALHGYILSKKAATYLFNSVKREKVNHHIDVQILKYIYNIKSYSTTPQLILQKDIDLTTSNNINSGYPNVITKHLSWRDKNGTPFNYKIAIGIYEIGGYPINTITVFVVLIGAMLGVYKVRKETVLTIFGALSLLELFHNINLTKSVPKEFFTNSIVTFSLLIISYIIFNQSN